MNKFLSRVKQVMTEPYTQMESINNQCAGTFFAIEYKGKIVHESISINRTSAMNKRAHSWWESVGDEAAVRKFKIVPVITTPEEKR